MSEHQPDGLYVYQPFGSVSHPDRAKSGRLFGVGGLPYEAKCQGLTRQEAEAIVAALTKMREAASPAALEEHGD
jgi:hypothetical protein